MATIKLGMIGGGPGAFIGAVHRLAAAMDGEMQLVCGAFSSDPEKSATAGQQLGLPINRVYGSWKEMLRREKELPPGERMEVVSIVTPNNLHFEPAKAALENGFHVVLDKPMTFSFAEALELRQTVLQSDLLFCLTHTYTGYPMVKEARQQVLSGKFGKIRKVYVEYPQGWLADYLEAGDSRQAAWRTDPARSGKAGAMGDIGTHAFNLAEYVSALQVTALCAAVNTVVPSRRLDDDGAALLRFNNGATGVLMATQVAAGEENDVRVRVYGEKGGLEWQQADANTLLVKWADRPTEIWRTGNGYLSSYAAANTRVPPGHPEGYLEAFANHYRNFAQCIQAKRKNEVPKPEWLDFPGIDDGIRGMLFIEKVIESGNSSQKWIDMTY